MNRRSLLATAAAAIAGGGAGCLDTGGSDEPPDEDRTDAGGTDVTDTPTDGGTPDDGDGDDVAGVRETRFDVLGSAFEFEEAATVRFEAETVTVSGTIPGDNTCYVAKLESVTLKNGTLENGTLVVNVESYEDAGEDEACGEAPIGIDYETVVVFEDELPSAVTVEHDGEQVVSEQRS
ncbi:Uncharacterized protein AArcCO_2774 [Halalkaliarchaeum sp. AArc-CO]|uniref:hypothetical protein n=1 Tax=Halalkaliarchaeum sp. AArc-CO TaxID=2866381 RepID=UPI00217D3EF0|nr:hypothetical protein [Halalkaliarchaeum sp. AArc-CO]UWG52052.1 Uncharacterized protein AArcCO_2774 [Halalkaliarchaeum sp. AArc-CO]